MISIRYFTPAAPLRPYLSSYYWFESRLPAFADLMRAELPQIRLVTTGSATNHYANGNVRNGVPAQLQGPTSGPVRFVADGALHLFGVGLLPQGWAALIGEPADRIADDVVDLAAVVGPCVHRLIDQIASAADDAARVEAADRFFLDLLTRAHSVPFWFTRMTDDWLTASTSPDLDTLIAASGMSSRSVERMAKRIYGASPKLLARKYRALQTAVQIGNGEVSGWADLAAGGFYDQAHFIREFKQFTGMTPARFMVEAASVTRITIARKKLLPDLPKLALYS
ncbi:MAG: helix-turn-helix domain-containing protein [Polymorphobacter sp.]